MAHAGLILDNPVSGERIEFRRTAADTNGEMLEIELRLAPDGKVPGAHVHPEQEERFEVIEGEMKFRMGLRKIIARPGDVVTVPAGKAHKFANNGEGRAVARVQVTPALDMEELFETTVELAKEGRVMRTGMPKPLDLALFVRRFRREVRAPAARAAAARDAGAAGQARRRSAGLAARYAETVAAEPAIVAVTA